MPARRRLGADPGAEAGEDDKQYDQKSNTNGKRRHANWHRKGSTEGQVSGSEATLCRFFRHDNSKVAGRRRREAFGGSFRSEKEQELQPEGPAPREAVATIQVEK